MKNWIEATLMGCLSFVLAMIVYALRALVVYIVWNCMMPELFTLPEINFWHAVGLVLLVSNLCTPITNIDTSKYKS